MTLPVLASSTICLSTACITKNMPFTFTSNRRWYMRSSDSSSGAMSNSAALLNSVSMLPKRWRALCTIAAMLSLFETSPAT